MTLPPDFWQWVRNHASDAPARLRLKYGRGRANEILQVEGRRKYRSKLDGVFSLLPEFVIPNALSPEQSTSWELARWHASLVPEGASVADFTAGMGVDVLALSRRASTVLAVERDESIADALAFNFREIHNVRTVCADCRELLGRGQTFDLIFIDPARRADDGSRLFALRQCAPDVVEMLPSMLEMAPTVIVKASPMLDIDHTLAELPLCSHIYAVGTTTECKETVCFCHRDTGARQALITAVTIHGEQVTLFDFTRSEERAAVPRFGAPLVGHYVYDPYPSVMKTGAFNLLSERYGAVRLGPNTQLWTSAGRVDFPGHAFRVTEVLPYASRHIKRYAAAHPRVSVTARNFDMDSAALRRKLGVADASDERLFAVKTHTGEKLLVTTVPI